MKCRHMLALGVLAAAALAAPASAHPVRHPDPPAPAGAPASRLSVGGQSCLETRFPFGVSAESCALLVAAAVAALVENTARGKDQR